MTDLLPVWVPASTVEAIAEKAAEIVAARIEPMSPSWLNVPDAADYLRTTPQAIRSLVKRRQLPVHRTPTGRVLFRRDELDAWVLSGDVR